MSISRGEDDGYAVTMTLREWLFIDAALDNVLATDRLAFSSEVDGDTGAGVRQKGWVITQAVVDAFDGVWPPGFEAMGADVAVTLSSDEWAVTRLALARVAKASETLGDTTEFELAYNLMRRLPLP